jgi:alkyl sulfatase BDS1-like metallo-beta-lactamase superfamily hydrolase
MNNIDPIVTEDPASAEPRPHPGGRQLLPDVFLFSGFANTYAVPTDAGLFMVDPGPRNRAQPTFESVRAWNGTALHTAVYTHGHADHAFGLGPWLAAGERPLIVAQENCPRRFERYHLTNGLNGFINGRQFGNPNAGFPDRFDWPNILVRDSMAQTVGGTEVRYRAHKGETDDALYAWLPRQRYLFAGDLVIWTAPNCGNPQKVQRYPVEWALALEEMAGLGAEWLFPGHGLVVHGEKAISEMLQNTAAWLRSIIDQVLERLNTGMTPEQVFHEVEPDPRLSKLPYLRVVYDHPKFIVRNLLRYWGGWWNGNAADLLPATWEDQAREVAALAGGVEAIVSRGRALLERGDLALACHLAEWAARGGAGNQAALEFKRDAYRARLAVSHQTMTQGVFRAAMNEAIEALGGEPEYPRPRANVGSIF